MDAAVNANLHANSLCLVRSLAGLSEAVTAQEPAAADYGDAPGSEERALLGEMRALAERAVAGYGAVLRYEVPWKAGGVSLDNHGDYVRQLCGDTAARLWEDIEDVATAWKAQR